MDTVQVVVAEVLVEVSWAVPRAAKDNARGANAVSEAAIVGVFHVDHALLAGEELWEFA